MKKVCVLFLILCLLVSSMSGVYAQSYESNVADVSKINATISYEGKKYDLSTLEGAGKYFQAKGQATIMKESYHISIDMDMVSRSVKKTDSQPLTFTNTKLIAGLSPQALATKTTFDLETKCRGNAAILKSTYKSYYQTYLVKYNGNPINAAAAAYSSTGVFFALMVKTAGPWDLKYQYKLSYLKYYDTKINGKVVSLLGDDIGNVHYGYVGKAMFPSAVLKSLAGMAQIAGGEYKLSWFTSYFDDPRDQVSIQRGIKYYDSGKFK